MDSDRYQHFPNTEPPRTCTFLGYPFPECYCVNLSSRHIARVLAYCAGAFESCPVYCSVLAQGAGRDGAPEPALDGADAGAKDDSGKESANHD